MKQTPNCIENEKWIALACSTEEHRPVLTNYKVYSNGTMVATNTHTMHVLLPGDTRITDFNYDYMTKEEHVYHYESPNLKKYGRVDSSANYPNWPRVAAIEHTRHFTINADRLMYVLLSFSKVASFAADRVYLRCKDDILHVRCMTSELEKGEHELEVLITVRILKLL